MGKSYARGEMSDNAWALKEYLYIYDSESDVQWIIFLYLRAAYPLLWE